MDWIEKIIGELPDINLHDFSFASIPLVTWTAIGAFILVLVMIGMGYQNGIVSEMSGLLSLLGSFIVIRFLSPLIRKYLPADFSRLARALIFLVIVFVVYKVLRYLLDAVGRLLRDIPVLGFISGVLGAAAGCIRAVLILLLVQLIFSVDVFGAMNQALEKIPFLQ